MGKRRVKAGRRERQEKKQGASLSGREEREKADGSEKVKYRRTKDAVYGGVSGSEDD